LRRGFFNTSSYFKDSFQYRILAQGEVLKGLWAATTHHFGEGGILVDKFLYFIAKD
jgi:hypothetical protein